LVENKVEATEPLNCEKTSGLRDQKQRSTWQTIPKRMEKNGKESFLKRMEKNQFSEKQTEKNLIEI
jgi:hypothetical protein